MAASYDTSLTHKKDQVRFLVRDTDTSSPLLQDEEIQWLLRTEANVYMAAASAAEQIASRLKGIKSKSVGGLSITYASSEEYTKVATNLRMRGRAQYEVPTAGGLSYDERDGYWDDTDLIKPRFYDKVLQDPNVVDPYRDDDQEEP